MDKKEIPIVIPMVWKTRKELEKMYPPVRQQGKSRMVDDLINHGVHIKKVTMNNIGEIKSEEIPYADFYSIDESNEL